MYNSSPRIAPPRVQLASSPTQTKVGENSALPKCHVTGFPVPVISRRKLPVSLSKDRTSQVEAILTVGGAQKQDTGLYVCHAKNSLGEH